MMFNLILNNLALAQPPKWITYDRRSLNRYSVTDAPRPALRSAIAANITAQKINRFCGVQNIAD